MKKVALSILVLMFALPSFGAVHFISQTLKPTATLVSYPVRHPKKTAKGTATGVVAVVKTVF